MPLEIERKFLVTGNGWRIGDPPGARFCQGYLAQGLATAQRATVRIRRADNRACVTIKGRRQGVTRAEFEYVIPVEDAEELLRMCSKPLIEKTRYRVHHADHVWAVDVFDGANKGLVMAEIELSDPDEPFSRPEWLGREVTHERRYQNSMLNIPPIAERDPVSNLMDFRREQARQISRTG
jgi:adenylate cyclase